MDAQRRTIAPSDPLCLPLYLYDGKLSNIAPWLIINLEQQFTAVRSTPFLFPPWGSRGIHLFKDIYNEKGLQPGFYLRLCSALKTYGAPWNVFPLARALVTLLNPKSCGCVSCLYSSFDSVRCSALPITLKLIFPQSLTGAVLLCLAIS